MLLSEKEKKYQSKRKKTISRFLQDSTIAVYNPKQSFDEETSHKGEGSGSNLKCKKTGKRANKNKINNENLEQAKAKKRISIKEYLLKNNLLMEENPEERFCICRSLNLKFSVKFLKNFWFFFGKFKKLPKKERIWWIGFYVPMRYVQWMVPWRMPIAENKLREKFKPIYLPSMHETLWFHQ